MGQRLGGEWTKGWPLKAPIKGRTDMDGSAPIFLEQDAWTGMIFSGGWGKAAGGVYDVTAPADGSVVASVGQGN